MRGGEKQSTGNGVSLTLVSQINFYLALGIYWDLDVSHGRERHGRMEWEFGID